MGTKGRRRIEKRGRKENNKEIKNKVKRQYQPNKVANGESELEYKKKDNRADKRLG